MTDSVVLPGVGEVSAGLQDPPESGPFIGTVDGSLSYTFGNPDIVTASVSSLLLDGSIVTGDRSENRLLELPLVLPGDADTRAYWYRLLCAAVDQPTFPILVTPDGGRTVVLDCFRGTVSRQYSTVHEGLEQSQCVLSIPAFPFTRSPDPVVLTPASSPIVGDAFESTTGLTAQSGGTLATTTVSTQGTNAVTNTFTIAQGAASHEAWVQHTVGPVNVSLMGQIRVDLKAIWTPSESVSLYEGPAYGLKLKLTDSSGDSATYRLHSDAGGGVYPNTTYHTFSTAGTLADPGLGEIVESSGTLDLSAVLTYRITLDYHWTSVPTQAHSVVWYLDNLVGMPAFATTTAAGQTVIFGGVKGGYRTPARLRVVKKTAGNLGTVFVHHRPGAPPGYDPASGSGTTFTGKALAYSGPHNIWAKVTVSGTATTALTITATTGGQSTSVTYTAAEVNADLDSTNYIDLGVLNLPPSPPTPENDAATFTITGSDTGGSGATVTVTQVIPFAMDDATTIVSTGVGRALFIDPAEPQGVVGLVYNSVTGTTRATGVSNMTNTIGAGTVHFNPGTNTLTVIADATWDAPAEYFPRWHFGRDS